MMSPVTEQRARIGVQRREGQSEAVDYYHSILVPDFLETQDGGWEPNPAGEDRCPACKDYLTSCYWYQGFQVACASLRVIEASKPSGFEYMDEEQDESEAARAVFPSRSVPEMSTCPAAPSRLAPRTQRAGGVAAQRSTMQTCTQEANTRSPTTRLQSSHFQNRVARTVVVSCRHFPHRHRRES